MRSLAGALAAGIVLMATQSPTSPRLAGETPAPASMLSLWYRAPASDHPLLRVGASPESRQAAGAEWVRALPVGNGRLGAMVFGGIVHERLQLNEDTLWAGRPYDPVNPRAKDALPEVRRLLAERKRASVRRRGRSRSCRAVLPVRPLPADCQLADRFAASESARPLEREHVAAMGQQVHHQYQHRDELLAGALDQSGRDDGPVDGPGVGSFSDRCANGARDVFDAHPPFQIDGNFGGTSAIAEMLLQCDEGEIRVLPALPAAWPDGRVTGLRTRGGFEIDLSWNHGALERASIRSLLGQPLRVRRGNRLRTFDARRGATLTLVGDDLRAAGRR